MLPYSIIRHVSTLVRRSKGSEKVVANQANGRSAAAPMRRAMRREGHYARVQAQSHDTGGHYPALD